MFQRESDNESLDEDYDPRKEFERRGKSKPGRPAQKGRCKVACQAGPNKKASSSGPLGAPTARPALPVPASTSSVQASTSAVPALTSGPPSVQALTSSVPPSTSMTHFVPASTFAVPAFDVYVCVI